MRSNKIMLTKMNIHNRIVLWITLVDKSVENVEKWGFSTGIRGFYPGESKCIEPCIFGDDFRFPAHYVAMVGKALSGKVLLKSWIPL